MTGGTRVALGVGMLRITSLSALDGVRRLKVEGRLVGASVEVLRLEVARAHAQALELELEVAGVEFADSQALTLLLALAKDGVSLVACSPLLTSLLQSRAP